MLPHALLTLHALLSSLTGTAGDGPTATASITSILAAIPARFNADLVPHRPIAIDLLCVV
jgi:hypothetical protein